MKGHWFKTTIRLVPVVLGFSILTVAGLIAFRAIVSIYFMAVEPFWLHAVMAAALGGVVAHILYLTYDLDNAFSGNLQISRDAFGRARRTVRRSAHRFDAAA